MPADVETRAVGDRGAFEPFHYRDYRLFWLGGTVANTGRWMQLLTLQKVVYDLTGSAAWAGAVGFANQLPSALMGPLAASLSDRYRRRRLLLVTQTVYAAVAIVMMLVWQAGVSEPLVYLMLAAGTGMVSGLNLPVWQAFVGNLVPRATLMKAITLNSAQFNTARAVGPAVGGLVLGVWGAGAALGLNAGAYAVVLLLLVMIQTDAAPKARAVGASIWGDFVGAVQLVRSVPGARRAVSMALMIGFLAAPLASMVVVFAEEVFDVSERKFGVLVAFQGVGGVLAAPFVSSAAGRVRRSQLALGAYLLYSASMVAFASTDVYLVGLIAIALVGAAHISAASAINSALQLQVSDEDRGKALAVYLMALMGSSPIGSLVIGFVADATSPRATVTGAGILLVAVVLFMRATGRFACLDDEGVGVGTPP